VKKGKTLVVGIGEVGGPLAEVLERTGPVLRHDIEPVEIRDPIAVMHLCFPFSSRSRFVEEALKYLARFRPALTIINSTVIPGTTRELAEKSGSPLAYSPVRGKHAKMTEELQRYDKFVAAPDPEVAACAADHFRAAGLRPRTIKRVETLELAKLAETTYFGLLIALAQELNRYAELVGADFGEATEFFEQIDFLPRTRYFPGFIGGHCVIPNIDLLLKVAHSPLLEAILKSNAQRARELGLERMADASCLRSRKPWRQTAG